MGISATTLSVGKGYTNLVALGLSDVEVNGTTITFTLNDGSKASVTLPTPKDGKDGAKGEKGDKGDKGDKGEAGEVAIEFTVVDVLPENGSNGVMYLVRKGTRSTQDIYDEYMWIDDAWEHIGSTEVNLNDYYTKSEVDERVKEVYSTNETVIGTWIDGKPVYRKVIQFNPSKKQYEIEHNIAIDNVITCKGWDGSNTLPVPIPSNTSYGKSIYMTRTVVGFDCGANSPLPSSVICILEYTKTTD